MGGPGSGPPGGPWWFEPSQRPIAEETGRIDLRALAREGAEWGAGVLLPLWGPPWAAVVRVRGCEAEILTPKRSWRVPVMRTPCPFGGSRPWFLCPECGRRALVLYLLGHRLVCRRCGGVLYRSQFQGPVDRLARKALRLRRRLGDTSGRIGAPPPPRPLEMRRTTYQRLLGELVTVEAALAGALEAWVAMWEARFARLDAEMEALRQEP